MIKIATGNIKLGNIPNINLYYRRHNNNSTKDKPEKYNWEKILDEWIDEFIKN